MAVSDYHAYYKTTCTLLTLNLTSAIILFLRKCTINIFCGAGVVDEVGGNSKRGFKWGGLGSLKNLSKKHLATGGVKEKLFVWGERVEKASLPLPPPQILIVLQNNSQFQW